MSFKLVLTFILWVLFFPGFIFAHQVNNKTTIHIQDSGFSPGEVTINQGETIVFENKGKDSHWPASNIHPTHQIYPEFDPKKPINPGEVWEFKFSKAGEWRMHDHLNPQITGKIIVKGQFSSLWERLINFFNQLFKNNAKYKYNKEISEDTKTIFKSDDDLYSYIKKFGPKQTVQRLHELTIEFGDCHQKAHEAGRIAYEIYGGQSFQKCSGECHSGCYHGATEAYFRDHGTANLTQGLNLICTGELNNFFSHQCIHGVGHGLMTYTNYDLNEALSSCDLLESRQDSCWTGVFMENFIGALSEDEATGSGVLADKHTTKYLNEDPQYPCNMVSEKYKSSCYFLQTSRMLQIFGTDFAKVASECEQVTDIYQRVCFESMGRDVGGVYRNNSSSAIEACGYAPDGQMRIGCLIGAVQDSFWDPTGADEAIKFCKMLTERQEKDACYTTIFARAPEVLSSKRDIETFCQKAESNYLNNCLAYAR